MTVNRRVAHGSGWTSQRLLAELGSEMLRSGTPVPEVSRLLQRVCTRWRLQATVAVFPTLVVVAVAGQRDLQVDLANTPTEEVRLDRSAEVLALVRSLADGDRTLHEGIRAFDLIQQSRPRFGPLARSVGHGLAALGIALLFHVSLPTVVAAAILGALAGAAKMYVRRGVYLSAVFPTALAFVVSTFAFTAAHAGLLPNPTYALVPALVTLLPGAQLATSVLELATADVVSGSSRLIAGLLQLVLLGVGVAVAVAFFTPSNAQPSGAEVTFGPAGAWIGIIVLGVGFWLYYCAPRRSLLPILICLGCAYAAQLLGARTGVPAIGAFTGAVTLAVVASLVHAAPRMPPLLVVFLPAFWLLAPGAVGLVGVADAIAQSTVDSTTAFAFASVLLAIALGTATGFGLVRYLAPNRVGD